MLYTNSLIQESILLAGSLLQEFTNNLDFGTKLKLTFGNSIKPDLLKETWTSGQFYLPEIEIISSADINNANGAYAQATNKIYLAEEFLLVNKNNLYAIANVVLEEYGHYLDSQLNDTDAAGDEGAIFAALVQGKNLSEAKLQQLKDEDDSAVVFLNGEEVAIEQNGEGTTTRVDISSNYSTSIQSASSDGRYIVFVSHIDNLVEGDTNNRDDVFVHDLQTKTTERISVSSNGTQANHNSGYRTSISSNGRYIVFTSEGNNLVPNDTNNEPDIFVHDRQAKITERVNVSFDGSQSNGFSGLATYGTSTISTNGRYVVFWSTANNLVPDDTNDRPDVFIHDRQIGATERISISSNDIQGNDGSSGASISADGRYVAFESRANNLISDDTNNKTDVFVHDLQTKTTERISVSNANIQGNNDSYNAFISADGKYIVFESHASNLVSDDTNNKKDLFLYALETKKIQRVNVSSNGIQADSGDNYVRAISADGKYIGFYSQASNMVSNDTNRNFDVFVHNSQTNTTERISISNDGLQGNDRSYGGLVSDNGRYVAFYSQASNLVQNDFNNLPDIFIRDRGESFSDTDDEEQNQYEFSEDASTLISNLDGNIGIINESGEFSLIASGNSFFDVALSEGNQLYGVTSGSSLYKANLNSGEFSLIGSSGALLNALAFDNNNGLYGAGDSSFYKLNLNTGRASLVANLGFNFESAGDLVFDPTSNTFFATSGRNSTNTLYSISLSGQATEIGNIGFNNVWGLSLESGDLVGFTADRKRISIDKQTGIGAFDKNITGISGQISGAASISRNNRDDNGGDNDNNDEEKSTPSINIYELLVKDAAYKNDWNVGDSINYENREYYKIDKIFRSENGFYGLGLTSDIYKPLLAIRGTEPIFDFNEPLNLSKHLEKVKDILTDTNPEGIGINQFTSDAGKAALGWLEEKDSPDIAGHSLGGGLAQLFAANLTGREFEISNVITFNSPGIPASRALQFDPTKANEVNHHIVSEDIVSMAGEAFIEGNATLYSYTKPFSTLLFEKHGVPIYNDEIGGLETENFAETDIPIETLNLANFNYNNYGNTSDEYIAFAFVTASLGSLSGASIENIFSRGDIEESRQEIGEAIFWNPANIRERGKLGPIDIGFNIGGNFNSNSFVSFVKEPSDNTLLSLQAQDLELSYNEDEDAILIQGKATGSIPVLKKFSFDGQTYPSVTIDLTKDPNPVRSINPDRDRYIKISDGDIDIVAEATFSKIPVIPGLIDLSEGKVFIDTEVNEVKGSATFAASSFLNFIPKTHARRAFGMGLGFVYSENNERWNFNQIELKAEDIGVLIPVLPGVFWQKLSLEADNISQFDPDDYLFLKAGVGFTYGPKTEGTLPRWLGDEKYEAALVTLDFALGVDISKDDYHLENVVGELQLEVFHKNLFSAKIPEAKWNLKKNEIKGIGTVEALAGVITANANFFTNQKEKYFVAYGEATVTLPQFEIGLDRIIDNCSVCTTLGTFALGGVELFNGEFYSQTRLDIDINNDFIAGWGNWNFTIPRIGIIPEKEINIDLGLKYYTATSRYDFIGADEIESTKNLIPGESSVISQLQFDYDLKLEDSTIEKIVDQTLLVSQITLTQFANTANYENIFNTAFGNNWNQNIADNIIQNWQTEKFNNLPTISLVNAEVIDHANAAFADETNTIYVAREYLTYQKNNLKAISDVLLEEIGHWVDSRINTIDAAGDEGNIFSRLVTNETISDEQLLALRSEDDTINISLNGSLTELNLNTSIEDTFSVVAETPWLSIAANWENDNNNVAIELVAPNGTVYTEADIANNEDINIIEELSDSTHRIVYINRPNAGDWTIKLPNNDDLGNVEFAALSGTNQGSIEITSLEQDTSNGNVTINYEAFDVDSDAQISFFYDTDDEGFDGFLIPETATENDGVGSFIWNTEGTATGEYYLYAMIADDNSIPTFDYSEQRIEITEEADLSVTQTANVNSVAVGDNLIYEIVVTNNGETLSKDVSVTTTIPEVAVFQSASIDFNSQTENEYTFDFGDLTAGEKEKISIIVTVPDTSGNIASQSLIASKTFDPDATNNIVVIDTVVEDESISDDDFSNEDNENTIELFRFRNTTYGSGTYIFVGEAERDFILENEDLSNTFALDGVDSDGNINPAFTASTEDGDDLIPFYRLESLAVPGTFLFVSTPEYDAIFAEDSNQKDQWKKQGFDENNNSIDIPEFYLRDNSVGEGIQFNRFQNTQNNTFLYAGEAETEAIESNPNLSGLFVNQGEAFRSL